MNSTAYFQPPASPLSQESLPVRSDHEPPLNNSAKNSPNPRSGPVLNDSPGYSQDEDASNQLPPVPTRIPYFRFLGPTAIAPGAPFREISMKLVRESGTKGPGRRSRAQSTNTDHSPLTAAPMSIGQQLGGSSPASLCELSSEGSINLSEDEFRRNVDVFYDHMGSYLSCIQKQDLLHRLSEGKASEALKLAISALAECIQPSSTTIDLAEIRSSRAKTLCMPHLSLPSLDTTFTLLLLAYCEFGREKDSGLWMWSGLALRMATDLGLHKSSAVARSTDGCSWDDSESGLRQRLFWSCYHLDRLISSGTGRVATLLDSEIEIELPRLHTIKTDDHGLEAQEELVTPMRHLTEILILLGQISDTFNRSKTNITLEQPAAVLQHFRTKLHIFYAGLPPVLHFTATNARRYVAVKHGQAFLLLHLWFHSLVIITHNPASVRPGWSSLDGGPIEPLMLEWSRGSVRTLCDMIAFKSMFDPDIFLGVPFASQPIMIAGLASMSQPSHGLSQPGGPGQQNQWRDFDICLSELLKMQTRWRGVSWLVSTLRSRARNEFDVDLSTSCGAEVSTCDSSLMNKLAENIQPAVRNPTNNSQPSQVQYFVGLSASGTFHEPASGRLSLVHQPDVILQAQSVQPSALAKTEVQGKEQNWQGPPPQPPTIPLAGPSNTPSGSENVVNHHAADEAEMHKARFETSPSELKDYPFNPVRDAGTGTAIHSDCAKADSLALQPFVDPSPSWVAQPIPLLWPTLESLDEFSKPVDVAQVQPGETSEGLIGNSGQSSGLRVETVNLSNGAQAESAVSPAVGNELWFQLFRAEEGVWSSFQNP